jgi:hypothetical protein
VAAREFEGRPLAAGVNADPVDVTAGLAKAADLGYGDKSRALVVSYALYRHAKGEENGAVATIRSHGIDFTSWRVILAAAVAEGTRVLQAAGPGGAE